MSRSFQVKHTDIHLPRQLPIALERAHKRDVRSQFAALPFRKKGGKVQVLLITSRGSGRWILPKGWPMLGKTPAEGAAQEAWEEAGVIGKLYDQCLGLYSYQKTDARKRKLPCLVMVYPIKVRKLAMKYPEAGQRRRKWFSLKKAASLVAEPELAQMIRTFDPHSLH